MTTGAISYGSTMHCRTILIRTCTTVMGCRNGWPQRGSELVRQLHPFMGLSEKGLVTCCEPLR